jgi:hypothetical protein
MRKVMALVVALAACGDDGGMTTTMDGGGPIDAEVMVDAAPTVEGMWRDTYHTTGGPVMAATSCTNAPTAIKVDEASGQVLAYPGTCKADGSWKIDAPGNLGTYYLRVGGILYETNKRAGIDLSIERLGRNDVAAITGVTLNMNLTGLQAWTAGDSVIAFSPNIGFKQNLTFTTGTPATNDTIMTATADWNGYKVDSTKQDTLQIVQLGKHTTGGGDDYSTLDRVHTASSVTMVNNAGQTITGNFSTGTAGSVALEVDVPSFNQLAISAGPSVTTRTVLGSAYASPSTDTLDSPPLALFARNSDGGEPSFDFGTLAYRDPFPASWQRMVKVAIGFTVPYSWNGVNGTLTSQTMRVQGKATASAGMISANVGPPTQVKFDGVLATTATQINGVPVLTWSAPTFGTATDYEIQVYEVKTTGGVMTFSNVVRIFTKQMSVRIPSGYLLSQRQYVFSVRARNRTGVDTYTTPLRNGTAWSMSEMLSALVTTN